MFKLFPARRDSLSGAFSQLGCRVALSSTSRTRKVVSSDTAFNSLLSHHCCQHGEEYPMRVPGCLHRKQLRKAVHRKAVFKILLFLMKTSILSDCQYHFKMFRYKTPGGVLHMNHTVLSSWQLDKKRSGGLYSTFATYPQ